MQLKQVLLEKESKFIITVTYWQAIKYAVLQKLSEMLVCFLIIVHL